ncbi:MAG: VOC family protein [Actinomycetota bacterium]|jgi:predicted enzyme related to lactoylglutathione lyase|nr:VOC family protein [Actinomycetota bacterium]
MLRDNSVAPTIPAKDLERARVFYRDTLELPIEDERADGIVFTCGDGTRLFVYPTEYAGTAKNTAAAFRVKDAPQEVKELKAKGVKFLEYDSGPIKTTDSIAEIAGLKGAWFTDTEGNIIAVFEG